MQTAKPAFRFRRWIPLLAYLLCFFLGIIMTLSRTGLFRANIPGTVLFQQLRTFTDPYIKLLFIPVAFLFAAREGNKKSLKNLGIFLLIFLVLQLAISAIFCVSIESGKDIIYFSGLPGIYLVFSSAQLITTLHSQRLIAFLCAFMYYIPGLLTMILSFATAKAASKKPQAQAPVAHAPVATIPQPPVLPPLPNVYSPVQPAQPQTLQALYCPACGNLLDHTNTFCSVCGKRYR